MRNLTISLDEKTAVWVRIHAAQQGKSISKVIGELLRERMHQHCDYHESMRHQLSSKAFSFQFTGGTRPPRAALNDRHSFR